MTIQSQAEEQSVAPALRSAAQRQRRRRFALTATLLVIYFGYLALIVGLPGFMRVTVAGNLTLALALGVVTIVALWLLACLCVILAADPQENLP
jgi:uncharacterized membrane protein (DUF485 family)